MFNIDLNKDGIASLDELEVRSKFEIAIKLFMIREIL